MKEEIIRLYVDENLSTHAVAARLSIGHKKVSDVLKENNVPIRSRGGQQKYDHTKTTDWSHLEGKILVCKETGKEFSDVFNKSGAISQHIQSLYPNIEIPSTFKRRMMQKQGRIWHIDFFTLKDNVVLPTRKCRYCDWETTDVMNKTGCYEVHLKDVHQKSLEQFIQDFPEEISFHPNFIKRTERKEFLSEEQNHVTCKVCGEKFKILTNKHLAKHGMTQEKYKLMFNIRDIISDSVKNQYKDNLLQVTLAGKMSNKRSSSYEKQISQFLDSLGVIYEKNNRRILGGDEIDFYLPTYKIGIEHHGLKWHTENFGKKDRQYHLKKTIKCEEQGIHLIQIFEDELAMKPDIVFNKLKHLLGLSNGEKIHARKCIIKEIDSNLKNLFLNKFHIQGANASPIKLGAFFNDKLIAVMCFDNQRKMNKTKNKNDVDEYELSRFCVANDIICSGIGSKLLKHFIKNYSPTKIISMADRRWTMDKDNTYIKMGFIKTSSTFPEYWYYNEKISRTLRYHKFRFGKKKIAKQYNIINIDSKSEKEWMKELGWDWIWDCGKLYYEMTF